jgi:hypothetical protein
VIPVVKARLGIKILNGNNGIFRGTPKEDTPFFGGFGFGDT